MAGRLWRETIFEGMEYSIWSCTIDQSCHLLIRIAGGVQLSLASCMSRPVAKEWLKCESPNLLESIFFLCPT